MPIVPQDSPTLFDGQICLKCQTWKVFDEYHVSRRAATGRHAYCKMCSTLVRRQYHAANKAKDNQIALHYYHSHKDQIRVPSPERRREWNRNWKRMNPGRDQANRHRRLYVEAQAEGEFTQQEWDELCARYDHRCLRCGLRRPLTVDHIVPLTKGGTHYIENIQPLCLPCNSSKKARTIDYRIDPFPT